MDALTMGFLGIILVVSGILAVLRRESMDRHKPRRPFLIYDRDARNAYQHNTDQLSKVTHSNFFRKRVMNASEYALFKIVEQAMPSIDGRCRVFAQTSLGEIIGSNDAEAHACINSKRIDIAVIGHNGEVVAAIEFQGGGHFQNNAAVRDAVKKEALRKAGIRYIEIFEGYSIETVKQLLRDAVSRTRQSGTVA